MKINLPSTFILQNARAYKVTGHSFISKLNQPDYQHPRKNENCEITCTNSF